LEDIPPRSEALAKRIPPVKERNPDFNMKSTITQSTAQQSSSDLSDGKTQAAFSATGNLGQAKPVAAGKDQQTVIPNLASYVTINPSLGALLQQAQGTALATTLSSAALTRTISLALDRAIREIIQPVVERSVTIACITTKEIVTKDFATEGDENKMAQSCPAHGCEPCWQLGTGNL
jgi:CCR4-NOT transcription complex subunit 1